MTKQEYITQYKNIVADTARITTIKDIIEDRIKPDYLSPFDVESYNKILSALTDCESKSLELMKNMEEKIIK